MSTDNHEFSPEEIAQAQAAFNEVMAGLGYSPAPPEDEAHEVMDALLKTLQGFADIDAAAWGPRNLTATFTPGRGAFYDVTPAQRRVLMAMAPARIQRMNYAAPRSGDFTSNATSAPGLPPGQVISSYTLNRVQAEAIRAHIKHGDQSMLGPSRTDEDRYTILAEEAGEAMALGLQYLAMAGQISGSMGRVAKELNEIRLGNRPDKKDLVKELIQGCAMFASFVEVIEAGDLQ